MVLLCICCNAVVTQCVGKGIRGGGKGKRGRGDDDEDDDGDNATLYLGGFPPGSAANGALEHALQQQVVLVT